MEIRTRNEILLAAMGAILDKRTRILIWNLVVLKGKLKIEFRK